MAKHNLTDPDCDIIEKWLIEEFSPEIEKWITKNLLPLFEKYLVEKYNLKERTKYGFLKKIKEI